MGCLALCSRPGAAGSVAHGPLSLPAGSLRFGSTFCCIQMTRRESSLTFMHWRRTARPGLPVCPGLLGSGSLWGGWVGWAGPLRGHEFGEAGLGGAHSPRAPWRLAHVTLRHGSSWCVYDQKRCCPLSNASQLTLLSRSVPAGLGVRDGNFA